MGTGLLFNAGALSAATLTACWVVVFFFASAGIAAEAGQGGRHQVLHPAPFGADLGDDVDRRGNVPPGVVAGAGDGPVGGQEPVGRRQAEVHGEVDPHVAEVDPGRPP